VADTFAGRRRFVHFIQTLQLEFGICFTLEEWERGFGIDELVALIAAKRSHPDNALRLAKQRLKESRVQILDGAIQFGLITSPLLVVAFVSGRAVAKAVLIALWLLIVGTVLRFSARDYWYAKALVAKIAGAA
jgi:hypothetical protein